MVASTELLAPPFFPRGAAAQMMTCHDREQLLEGPAGSGKTRPILELFHLFATNYPGFRGLITRKVGATLATSTLVTFRRNVLKPQDRVRFFGGSKDRPAAFQYPNGSEIVVGGLDVGADGQQSKVLSNEYDAIYPNEAVELTLEDWETLTTRLRPFVLKHPRLIGDTNPAAGKHWLNKRCEEGKVTRFRSRLEDNPRYFNDDGTMTEEGVQYIETLDRLTGARYQRLRLGEWVGVENAVYPNFDRSIHVRPLEQGLRWIDGAIGVDYGRRHMSALVVILMDQYNRRWVVDAWAEADDERGAKTKRNLARLRDAWPAARRGRTDPGQDVLAGDVGYEVAQGANGTRIARTQMLGPLFDFYPGGRVPKRHFEARQNGARSAVELGPYAEADTPGLLFVEGAPYISELCDQIEGYQELMVENKTATVWQVVRKDDDLVAALEYGNEELETAPPSLERVASKPTVYRKARVA